MRKIVIKIKGGLGNQLFEYAAARRLALVNDAELIIDDVTGFIRDSQFHRKYMLDRFNILARKATPAERLEPFGRYRSKAMKWLSYFRHFEKRNYLEQEDCVFDERFLTLKVTGTVYLEGYWQSERYFKDVRHIIRNDLQIITPTDKTNLNIAEKIRNSQSVALHVRQFDAVNNNNTRNISTDYYRRAIILMEERVKSPHYYIFSDDYRSVYAKLDLPKGRATCISNNMGDENAYADLWLMSQCKNIITANSTFSWWGAWLAENPGKIIIAPKNWYTRTEEDVCNLLPEEWHAL